MVSHFSPVFGHLGVTICLSTLGRVVSRSTTPSLILCVQVSLSTLGRVVSQPHVTIVRHFVHRFSLSTLGGVVSYYYFLHLGSSTSILFSSIHQYPVGPSSSTIPRKFNSDERKAADKVLRSQIRTARFFQCQARIERRESTSPCSRVGRTTTPT